MLQGPGRVRLWGLDPALAVGEHGANALAVRAFEGVVAAAAAGGGRCALPAAAAAFFALEPRTAGELSRGAAGRTRLEGGRLAAILAVALKAVAAVIQAADAVAGAGAAEAALALAAAALEVATVLAAGATGGQLAVVDAEARGAVARRLPGCSARCTGPGRSIPGKRGRSTRPACIRRRSTRRSRTTARAPQAARRARSSPAWHSSARDQSDAAVPTLRVPDRARRRRRGGSLRQGQYVEAGAPPQSSTVEVLLPPAQFELTGILAKTGIHLPPGSCSRPPH
jgi:hypothetical protein